MDPNHRNRILSLESVQENLGKKKGRGGKKIKKSLTNHVFAVAKAIAVFQRDSVYGAQDKEKISMSISGWYRRLYDTGNLKIGWHLTEREKTWVFTGIPNSHRDFPARWWIRMRWRPSSWKKGWSNWWRKELAQLFTFDYGSRKVVARSANSQFEGAFQFRLKNGI